MIRPRPADIPGMPDDPILLVVRRGAHHRFGALQRKAAHLDVKVIWDRRRRAQRQSIGDVQQERRASDRRLPVSPSWQLADFAVSLSKPPQTSD